MATTYIYGRGGLRIPGTARPGSTFRVGRGGIRPTGKQKPLLQGVRAGGLLPTGSAQLLR